MPETYQLNVCEESPVETPQVGSTPQTGATEATSSTEPAVPAKPECSVGGNPRGGSDKPVYKPKGMTLRQVWFKTCTLFTLGLDQNVQHTMLFISIP